MVIPCIV